MPCHAASPRYVRFVALSTAGHTSDARGCTGALPAGLWERLAGRPSGLPDASLQSVLNAAARLIYRLTTRDHASVCTGCWFRNELSRYIKLAVLAYKVLHGDAPRYLGPLTRVDDLPGRRTLRSTSANRLVVPPVKLSTVGSRAFAVAAPHIWNTLPTDVVAANSLSVDCETFFIQAIIS